MSRYGSLHNELYSRMVKGQPEPEIGMGASVLSYSDRKAASVIAWDAKREIVSVQFDIAKRVDGRGMSESQEYEYSPDPKGRIERFRRSKEGFWQNVFFNSESKRWNKIKYGYGLRLGERDHYYDFSF